jgi:glycosyltransferase involved in cell wall biosynthesis
MKPTRLIYVSGARLPTEKAHGHQICRMCEAFARCGVAVVLLHPRRRQPDPGLRHVSVFDFYGIPPIFTVRTTAVWDVLGLGRAIPRSVAPAVAFAQALGWGRSAAHRAGLARGDLYYTRDVEPAYWLARGGLPFVFEAHDVPARARLWLLRRVLRSAALRLAVGLTAFIRDRLVVLGAPPERVAVAADGVDLERFTHLPDQAACRRRLGLPADRPIIGYVGRFVGPTGEKGLPDLIAALTHLPPGEGGGALLLCVGGPRDPVHAYRSLARRLGLAEQRVRFVDRVPAAEVPLWMRAADVVTIPWPWTEFSAYYTSPLKLFEYMAADVPIVATDLPALREVLRHGENAWLVPAGDPRALGGAIARLLDDETLRRRLAARARQDVSRYTWAERAAAILAHAAP